jgi:hypothetical protein
MQRVPNASEPMASRLNKKPLPGFMRIDRGMVIVGYGRHTEWRVGSSPAELIARLLLSELERARCVNQKTEGPEEKGI